MFNAMLESIHISMNFTVENVNEAQDFTLPEATKDAMELGSLSMFEFE